MAMIIKFIMQVNTNGVLSFQQSFGAFSPQSFPLDHTELTAVVALYWADHDIRIGGLIFYRVTEDEVLLDSVGSEISSAFNTSFSPTWLFIATWEEVVDYAGHPNIVRSLL